MMRTKRGRELSLGSLYKLEKRGPKLQRERGKLATELAVELSSKRKIDVM